MTFLKFSEIICINTQKLFCNFIQSSPSVLELYTYSRNKLFNLQSVIWLIRNVFNLWREENNLSTVAVVAGKVLQWLKNLPWYMVFLCVMSDRALMWVTVLIFHVRNKRKLTLQAFFLPMWSHTVKGRGFTTSPLAAVSRTFCNPSQFWDQLDQISFLQQAISILQSKPGSIALRDWHTDELVHLHHTVQELFYAVVGRVHRHSKHWPDRFCQVNVCCFALCNMCQTACSSRSVCKCDDSNVAPWTASWTV